MLIPQELGPIQSLANLYINTLTLELSNSIFSQALRSTNLFLYSLTSFASIHQLAMCLEKRSVILSYILQYAIKLKIQTLTVTPAALGLWSTRGCRLVCVILLSGWFWYLWFCYMESTVSPNVSSHPTVTNCFCICECWCNNSWTENNQDKLNYWRQTMQWRILLTEPV